MKILPPDINRSQYKFTVDEQGHIIYGLGAIKGVGEAAMESMVEVRNQVGPFADLFMFCRHMDGRKLNRRTLESLIRAGAMDSFGVERASLMASLEMALQVAEQHAHSQNIGQEDLFGGALNPGSDNSHTKYVAAASWTEEERLLGEKETLGLYLSGHPITRYEEELAQFITARIIDLKPNKGQTVLVAGLVVAIKTIHTKSGNRIAFLTLDDRTARIEMAAFSEVYSKYRELIQKDQLLIVEGEVSIDDFTGGYRISSQRIFNIDQARELFAKSLWLKIHDQQINHQFLAELKQKLSPFSGGRCPVYVSYNSNQAGTKIALGSDWNVRPLEKLLHGLYQLCGKDNVLVGY